MIITPSLVLAWILVFKQLKDLFSKKKGEKKEK